MIQASSFARALGLGTLLLVLTPLLAVGQSSTVSGRVTNTDLHPVAGATVRVEGDTAAVTLTDSQGRYSIVVPRSDATLVFTALGFREQKSALEGRTTLSVVLQPDPLQLQELTVVGYARQGRATVSGSVTAPSLERKLAGILPCDGAALSSPPALVPESPPLRMPSPEPPPAPIPNSCAVATPEADAR